MLLPFLGLAAIIAFMVIMALKMKPAQQAAQEEVHEAPQVAAAPRVNRMQAGMRRRRAGARAARDAGGSSEEEEGEDERRGGGRLGRGAQEEQAAPREAPELNRRAAYDAKRAAKDAEREAQEAAQEAEMARAAAERAKREEEEAAKWMHLFTVEGAGEDAVSEEQGEALLSRFVEYVQQRKTVPLDELAAEFGMKSAEAISKLQALEASGRITGVMDDRGKFIFISPEEMQAVADFIDKRGRIAISELAQRSNAFIDLSEREVGGAQGLVDLDLDLELPPPPGGDGCGMSGSSEGSGVGMVFREGS